MSLIIIPTLSLPSPVPEVTSGKLEHYIDTLTVIEHATRRCLGSVASLNAEQLDMAKSNLHLILSALSNRGVNLWAVDRHVQPLVRGCTTYALPSGTEKLVTLVHRDPSRIAPSVTVFSGLSTCSVTLSKVEQVSLIGFKLPVEFEGRLAFDVLDSTEQWTMHHSFGDIKLSSGWHWYIFDASQYTRAFRIRDVDGNPLSVDDMMVCSSSTDTNLVQLNRDQYTAIPDKSRVGKPNSYYFEKLIDPLINVWPAPQDDASLLVTWRQRRIQDVGSLYQKLEIPDRWFDSIVWSLAKNMAFELPNVPDTRIDRCVAQAEAALRDAELGENDQAPMYIQPNISGYTA